MQKVYALNNRLGIYVTDDNYETIANEIADFDNHNGSPDYEPVELEYVKDIDASCLVIPDDCTEIQNFINNLSFSAQGSTVVPPCLSGQSEGNPIRYVGEYNSGELVVNSVGYIPLVRRIEDLLRAGETLRAYRDSIYDGHDVGNDDLSINPITAPNADMVDIDRAIKKAKKTIDLANEALANQAVKDSQSSQPEGPPAAEKPEK